MGRRKNNPDLVEELIDGLWTMDQNEFEQKYNSLSSSDMSKVGAAICDMENEEPYLYDDEPESCATCYDAYPDCTEKCPLFDIDEWNKREI